PRGRARWLLGAAGRRPLAVGGRTAARAAEAAASLHLDRQATATTLLAPGEAETWLPWLTQTLPRIEVPVRLLDGAVVLGAPPAAEDDAPDTAVLSGVPDTDPLVLEVRWHDGAREQSRRALFRGGEPAHAGTRARTVGIVTL